MFTMRLTSAVAAVLFAFLNSACTGTVEDTGTVLTHTGGVSSMGGVSSTTGGVSAVTGGASSIVSGGTSAGGQATQVGNGGATGGTPTTGTGGATTTGGVATGGGAGGKSSSGAGGASAGRGGMSSGTGGGAGASSCPGTQLQCSGTCVDTNTSAMNCGACGKACASGSTCTNGACSCSGGKSSCGTSCVDLTSDAANCGACGIVCGSGRSCQQGMCQCATGQTACGASCVNLMTDAANCGSCGTLCPTGQACGGGQCTTGGGTGADGCMGLAQNLTLSQIAVYQTVKVPLMQNGTEVATTGRKADIVAGRDAVFRLFVTPGSGWAARELSGRVLIDNGGTVDTYFAKKSVSAASTEATLDSTFVVTVPKDKVTTTTKYQVEIVECGTGSGTVTTPRFPAADKTALGAKNTGVLKIKVVPISANSMQPDTSDTALNVYKALFLAMYPITSLEFTVDTVLNAADDQDWTGMLDAVRARRAS